MDIINKIEQIQYYSNLPFGELYDESIYLKFIKTFNFNHTIYNDHISTNTLGDYFNPSYFQTRTKQSYHFCFEIDDAYINDLSRDTKNIILNLSDRYVLLKDIEYLKIEKERDDITRYTYSTIYSYNYGQIKPSFNVVVTGMAKELLEDINKYNI